MITYKDTITDLYTIAFSQAPECTHGLYTLCLEVSRVCLLEWSNSRAAQECMHTTLITVSSEKYQIIHYPLTSPATIPLGQLATCPFKFMFI